MPPVETEYYDLLCVPVDVNDTDLKKAYRKQAMRYHPDKNPSPDAEEKFKDISKAYQVLSDPNLRTVYDKNGKSMVDKEGAINIEDAAGFFANVFGGERFVDYIGEISIMKDMTSVATTMMTEEEKADVEKQLNADLSSPGPSVQATLGADAHASSPKPATSGPSSPTGTSSPVPPSQTSGEKSTSSPRPTSEVPAQATTHVIPHEGENSAAAQAAKEKERDAARRRKATAEQKEKLRIQERERRIVMEARVKLLTEKMIERLRPFVEAKNPGADDDEETVAFKAKMQREAEDLKLESFGVELLHAIGTVYAMKATSFMKSKKLLGIPGFFSRLKEKGSLAKDVWGVIGSALSVRDLMLEMEKLQAKGDADEEQLRALEMDVTGKIMLASWRGARLEVIQVLREVVDQVLKDDAGEAVHILRAKALLTTAAIFKAAQADETDEERRELERMVAQAALPRPKHAHPAGRPAKAKQPKDKEATISKDKEKEVQDTKDKGQAQTSSA